MQFHSFFASELKGVNKVEYRFLGQVSACPRCKISKAIMNLTHTQDVFVALTERQLLL